MKSRKLEWKVAENGCWEVISHRPFNGGYVRTMINSKLQLAHRRMYENCICKIPEGLCVLHHCDNPICVNPEHLFLGTNADNMADKVAKNRQSKLKGESNGRHRLTEAEVLEIYHNNLPQIVMAKKYGVGQPQICYIRTGRNWAWLTGHRKQVAK